MSLCPLSVLKSQSVCNIFCLYEFQINVGLYISNLLLAVARRACNFPWHDFRQNPDGSIDGS